MEHQQRGVAVVTGAGSADGIGAATALLLGRAGMSVVITSTTDRIEQRAAELRSAGVSAVGVVADLTGQDGVDRVFAAASEAFGAPAVLVNNAGMTSLSDPEDPASVDDISIEQWRTSLDRNLTTALRMTRAAVPLMRAAGYGRIINVSSLSGPVQAYTGDVAYHAAKAGMLGLTRAVAVDTAAAGITVNAVAPGWIRTASSTDREIAMGHATPIGRPGTPAEVAAAIGFLASAGASYITGQLLVIDGANSINEERAM
ncbi:SDR family NAD(P)-dependent oxidoreductase [Leifsonia sp. 22587]|uniref:SDR family NAD(P)-dependent oxidoreductase n=1 Tax=Leifsonia sp. 22587 TaxID=3453946 RepID=UPI003F82C6E2